MTNDANAVRLTIPAKAEYITLCRLALAGLSTLRELPDEALADLKLALTEACTNSVRHAYGDSGGVIDVVYELHSDRLVIEVSDDGKGFVPEQRADAREGLSESGLGIAIIRALADEVELGEREDGRGSRLRIVKLLD
ncbi:MAG: ATP-binding protein [Actinomycetota bacterium]|nr:ATP-binding protein [Actinomycetota bacterium]